MNDDIRVPDIELIINAGGSDVAVCAFYKVGDIHDGFEVVWGIGGKSEIVNLDTLLNTAIKTLHTARWGLVPLLDIESDEKSNDPPF